MGPAGGHSAAGICRRLVGHAADGVRPADCPEQRLAQPPEQDLASDPDLLIFDPCESLTGTIDAETLVHSCETGDAAPRTATYAVGPARDQLDTGG